MADPTPKDIPPKLLERLYLREGLSGRQIAERLGEAQATVYRRLKALGLTSRKGGERSRRTANSFLDGLLPGRPQRIAVEGNKLSFVNHLRERS
jgi:hypothetical protein